MTNIKHIGRIKNNKRRAIVAYRTIPGDPYSALVVLTEALPADEHDALIRLVESATGQQSDELADAMARAYLADGRNMLAGFHHTGQLKKVPTDQVEMTPNNQTSILLSELNEVIAQQKGIALDDLAVKDQRKPANVQKEVPFEVLEDRTVIDELISTAAPAVETPLTELEMAVKLRSTADALFKEAQALRKQAESLAPAKKKEPVKKATSVKA